MAMGLFPAAALMPAHLRLCVSSSASLSFRFFIMKWGEIAISLHMLVILCSDLNTVHRISSQ